MRKGNQVERNTAATGRRKVSLTWKVVIILQFGRPFRAILRNSFRLMQIRGPWLAYVLVRQLCFIVADEDVRHAQPPQSERYSENNFRLPPRAAPRSTSNLTIRYRAFLKFSATNSQFVRFLSTSSTYFARKLR